MSKATETKLNKLHGDVAQAYTDLVNHTETEVIFEVDGSTSLGAEKRTATPALLAAAGKFLKDNNIEADKEAVDNIGQLRDALANKTRHSRLGNAADAAKTETH